MTQTMLRKRLSTLVSPTPRRASDLTVNATIDLGVGHGCDGLTVGHAVLVRAVGAVPVSSGTQNLRNAVLTAALVVKRRLGNVTCGGQTKIVGG